MVSCNKSKLKRNNPTITYTSLRLIKTFSIILAFYICFPCSLCHVAIKRTYYCCVCVIHFCLFICLLCHRWCFCFLYANNFFSLSAHLLSTILFAVLCFPFSEYEKRICLVVMHKQRFVCVQLTDINEMKKSIQNFCSKKQNKVYRN